METELNDLTSKLSAEEQRGAQTAAYLTQSEQKCVDYERQCAAYDQKCIEFERQCAAYETQCTRYDQRCQDYEQKCGNFEKRCADYDRRCAEYEQRCTDSAKQYAFSEQLCADYEKKYSTYEIKCSEYEQKCSESLEKCSELEAKLVDVMQTNTHLLQQISSSSLQLTELQTEFVMSQETRAQVERRCAELQTKIAEADLCSNKLKNELAEAAHSYLLEMEKCSELKRQFGDCARKLSDTQEQHTSLQLVCIQLEKNCSDSDSRTELALLEKRTCVAENERFLAELAALQMLLDSERIDTASWRLSADRDRKILEDRVKQVTCLTTGSPRVCLRSFCMFTCIL
jgi:chromosome segregation ATPase